MKWNVNVTVWYQLCSDIPACFAALLPWFLGLSWGKCLTFLSYIWQIESAECSGKEPGCVWSYTTLKNSHNPCVLVLCVCSDRLHNKWLQFNNNCLTQHTRTPAVSQYHFHSSTLLLTGGLTTIPCYLAACTHITAVSRERVLMDGAPRHACIHHGGSGDGSCASLVFPQEASEDPAADPS